MGVILYEDQTILPGHKNKFDIGSENKNFNMNSHWRQAVCILYISSFASLEFYSI